MAKASKQLSQNALGCLQYILQKVHYQDSLVTGYSKLLILSRAKTIFYMLIDHDNSHNNAHHPSTPLIKKVLNTEQPKQEHTGSATKIILD